MSVEYGKTLDSTIIERGLRELNPDINFDLAGRIGQVHPYILDRQGVYYMGKHICAMDRGMVSEFKLWSMHTMTVPVSWSDADKEGTSIRYRVIPKSDPNYADLYRIAETGKDHTLMILSTGKLVRTECVASRKVKHRIVRCGWRHTFERLILANIPGVTRDSIGAKFGVNMWKFPQGTPDEIFEAVWAE